MHRTERINDVVEKTCDFISAALLLVEDDWSRSPPTRIRACLYFTGAADYLVRRCKLDPRALSDVLFDVFTFCGLREENVRSFLRKLPRLRREPVAQDAMREGENSLKAWLNDKDQAAAGRLCELIEAWEREPAAGRRLVAVPEYGSARRPAKTTIPSNRESSVSKGSSPDPYPAREASGMQRAWLPQVVASVLLLGALNPYNPYGYYILLRWVCFGVFGYLTFTAIDRQQQVWAWVLGVTAAIYNPFLPLHLTRDIWSVVNLITIGIAIASVAALKCNDKRGETGKANT